MIDHGRKALIVFWPSSLPRVPTEISEAKTKMQRKKVNNADESKQGRLRSSPRFLHNSETFSYSPLPASSSQHGIHSCDFSGPSCFPAQCASSSSSPSSTNERKSEPEDLYVQQAPGRWEMLKMAPHISEKPPGL